MLNNDYIVSVDEAGQPYIAHAFGNHKYYQKIFNGPKALYFYSKEQFENYLRRLRERRFRKKQKRFFENNWTSSAHGLTGRTAKNVTGPAKEGWSKRRTID